MLHSKGARLRLATLVACVGIFGCLYLANASWLAPAAHGVPRVVAQRGMSQAYRSGQMLEDSCTAKSILTPSHLLIDNTMPSIAAAFAAGTDIVEIDIRITRDDQFVLFHDDGLACRTDGLGRVSERSVSELKAFDVGYGYTADEGKSFPLRGKGVGLMPTLAEVLHTYANRQFLIQIKDGGRGVADSLVAYLRSNQLEVSDHLTFFGAAAPLFRLREIIPIVRTWSARSSEACLRGYLEAGWFGHVPSRCDGGMIIIPIDQAGFLWGWPNRFLARMRRHHTDVMLIGRIDSLATAQFTRLDTIEELSRIPAGFDGLIWTDRIGIIGPAVRSGRR
jgi:glycerophosphoryl diester phosphodiesterase